MYKAIQEKQMKTKASSLNFFSLIIKSTVFIIEILEKHKKVKIQKQMTLIS